MSMTVLVVGLVFVSTGWGAEPLQPELRDGDLVFHRSRSAQSTAISEATGSDLTHVGVVFIVDERPMVFEAVQPVTFTPYTEWVKRGVGATQVRRLKNADEILIPDVVDNMRALAGSWVGTGYDSRFNWSDDELYCSELVWKLFDRTADVQLGSPRPFNTFELSAPEVRQAAQRRFPDGVPHDELAVSPQDIFEQEFLVDVRQDVGDAN